jgi:hypothetical protein
VNTTLDQIIPYEVAGIRTGWVINPDWLAAHDREKDERIAALEAQEQHWARQSQRVRQLLGGYILQATQDGGFVDPAITEADDIVATSPFTYGGPK